MLCFFSSFCTVTDGISYNYIVLNSCPFATDYNIHVLYILLVLHCIYIHVRVCMYVLCNCIILVYMYLDVCCVFSSPQILPYCNRWLIFSSGLWLLCGAFAHSRGGFYSLPCADGGHSLVDHLYCTLQLDARGKQVRMSLKLI